MPSPFPGMDPYLEGDFWTTVHADLIGEIGRQLSPKLQPRYVARTQRRHVLDAPEGVTVTQTDRYPDVGISAVQAEGGSGNATVATAPLQLETVLPAPSRVPQLWVEIRDTNDGRLVTDIEVLSPTNKRGIGREQHLDRRRDLLLSSAHLVEIDLLRQGARAPMRRPLPESPYFVFTSRVEHRPLVDVWPIALRASLPTVFVPLLPGDADVSLDLQSALTAIYDVYRYDLSLNYRDPPKAPLDADDAAWTDGVLRAAGLRP